MPVFACRWPSGDLSLVSAPNKAIAEERLDEVGDASGVVLRVVPEFMIHLTLSDAGLLEFQGFGEASEEFVDFDLYPALTRARMETLTEKGQPPTEAILAAVEVDRTRVFERRNVTTGRSTACEFLRVRGASALSCARRPAV